MRKRFSFWLDDKRSEDVQLYEVITELKKNRQFSRAIREGVRLWVDSDTSALEDMPTKLDSTGGSGAGQLDEIKALLEMIIAQNKSGLLMRPSETASLAKTTGKLLGGQKPLSLPSFDDDELPKLAVSKVNRDNSSSNFLTQLSGLQF